MRIIIASDTHGRTNILDLIPYYYEDVETFIHCGDVGQDPDYFEKWKFVSGNNDFYYDLPEAIVVKAENHRILVIHSDQFYYHNRKKGLVKLAKKHNCDIVCYGHTHISDIDEMDGILLINPGSLRLPRDGKPCSYCVLTINEKGLNPEIVFEDDWPF